MPSVKCHVPHGCDLIFCSAPLTKHARGKGLSSPAILPLRSSCRSPGCWLRWCHRSDNRRSLLLLVRVSLSQAMLLFASTGRRTGVLTVSQRVFPSFLPPLIAQVHAQGQHRIDVLWFPMHSCSIRDVLACARLLPLSTMPEPMGQPAC